VTGRKKKTDEHGNQLKQFDFEQEFTALLVYSRDTGSDNRNRRQLHTQPGWGLTAYSIPIHDPAAFPFMWVKGIRDIFSGLVVLSFLWRGDRRTTAILFALAILIPVGDGLVILSRLGFAPPIYIHWGTALYMAIVAAFLLRRKAA
jgi:hypothetical protein